MTEVKVEPIIETDNMRELSVVLSELKIKATVESCQTAGPLRKYTVRPEGATRFVKFEAMSKDIGMRMCATSNPVARQIPGTDTIGLDMMFGKHPVVSFEKTAAALLATGRTFEPLEILLGTTEIDKPLVVDIAKMPHLGLGGTTGSGKSMSLHAIINSLTGALGKRDVRLALIDPKQVEFSRYGDLDALDYEVATTLEHAAIVMTEVEKRMRDRLTLLTKAGCKDIGEYRASGKTPRMPYVVVVIDEIADLVRGRTKSKFFISLINVGQMGRAAGIHLVFGTQHPSADVITGPIKANFPSKIGFKVSTDVHSRVLLGSSGAEHLVGKGDALLIDGENHMLRFQGALVELIEPKPFGGHAEAKRGIFSRLAQKLRK